MTYTIVDWEIDEAGKRRIRVDINGATVMFKYDTMPDDAQVQADAKRYEDFKNYIPPSETGE